MKPPVVILSSVEWDASWQRHQAFAAQWAAAGHEVVFVENTGLRNPRLTHKDLSRLWRRVTPRPGRLLPAGLRVATPRVLPPTFGLFRALNEAFFVPRLAAGLPKKAVVFCYLPTATTLQLLAQLDPSLTVYDCVDNLHGLPFKPQDLPETEAALMSASALVVTTSRTLYEEKSKAHGRVLELHHGVAPAFFVPPHPKRPPKKLCYFGTLWNAVDYEPVRALAEAGFEVTLLGPVKEPVVTLPKNVRLLPPMPHDRLPQALFEQDALLLPYRESEYNRGVIPAKLYECLATGRPVLASPLPALEPLSSLLYIARTPQEWVDLARKLPELETPGKAEARVAAAREHALERQFAKLRAALDAAEQPPQPKPALSRPAAYAKGLAWIGAFYGLAKLSTLLTQTLAGRMLGPVEYGRAGLIAALAAYVQILPMLGFPLAMAKLVSDEDAEERRRRLISSTLACFAVWAVLSGVIVALLGAPLLVCALSFCTAVYTVVSSALLGLKRFDERGLTETFYGLLAPVLALAFLAGERSHESFIWALCAALFCGTLRALWSLRGQLARAFDLKSLKPVAGYAAVGSLTFLATACVLAPGRLFLNAHFGAREVGVFSAYFTATVQVSLALLTMATAVIVPLSGGGTGKHSGWALPAFALSWPAFSLMALAALLLFGRQYPLNFGWLALFSAAAALVLVHGVTAAALAGRGFRGLCLSVAGSLVAGAANAALGWLLIPRYGIAGAGLALAGGYLLGLAAYAAFSLESAS